MKADILPLKDKETQAIKDKIEVFKQKVSDFRKEFLDQLPFGYEEKMTIE